MACQGLRGSPAVLAEGIADQIDEVGEGEGSLVGPSAMGGVEVVESLFGKAAVPEKPGRGRQRDFVEEAEIFGVHEGLLPSSRAILKAYWQEVTAARRCLERWASARRWKPQNRRADAAPLAFMSVFT